MVLFYILLAVSLMSFLPDLQVSSDLSCAEKPEFTQSSLVVQFGKPTSALCSLSSFHNIFDIESPIGVRKRNGTTVSWTVNSMTEWNIRLSCYYTNDTTDEQCFSILPITVYKPPDNVSISFVNHAGPMSEGQQYTLQCDVQDVAPAQNLIVTFYRGQTVLGELKSNKDQKKPVSEVFTLNITSTKEEDGLQFWCEAKLELGAEGPQQPPVVESEKLTATVLYKPQLKAPLSLDPIIVQEGNPLQLNCSSVGNPPPLYTWTLPSKTTLSSNYSSFFINSTTPEDEGLYICSVTNDKGSITFKFAVQVKVNNLAYIICMAVLGVFLAVVLVGIAYFSYHRYYKVGGYNMLARFHSAQKQTATPPL